MSKIEYYGNFSFPDSENKYPGQIIGYDEKQQLILELYGNLSIDNNSKSKVADNYKIILGYSVSHQNLSLLDCQFIGQVDISNDFFKIRYSVRIICKNILIRDYNTFKLSSLTFCMPFIPSWYDGLESRGKLYNLDDNNKKQKLQINDDLKIIFEDNTGKNSEIFGEKYEVTYRKNVQFSYKTPKHFDNIISDIYKLKNLLEFSTSKTIHFKLINGSCLNGELRNIKFDNFSFTQKQNIYKNYLHQNCYLFSRAKLSKETLDKLITNWFSNSKYYPIYDLYLDSLNWFKDTGATLSNVMFNNRCLNLIQALESYHRIQYKTSTPDREEFNETKNKVLKLLNTDAQLKQWTNDRIKFNKDYTLKERLTELIEKSEDIITGLFNIHSIYTDFPYLAKKYRNILSHGIMENTHLGNEMHFLYHSAKLLLTIVILSSLGLDNEIILKQIKSNHNFRKLVGEIQRAKRNMITVSTKL